MTANPVPYTVRETLLQTDRKGYAVEMIVVHETAGSYPGDLNWLVGSGQVSVNWYIDPWGKVYCLDEQFGATAHAGKCRWGRHQNENEGKDGWAWANLASEGIEVCGPNNGQPFSSAQIASLQALTLWRLDVYRLPIDAVVSHAEIAYPPGRKNDPRGMNWDAFIASLTPPPQPTQVPIGGINGQTFYCEPDFKEFYDIYGGILVFGYATGNQYKDNDESGELCD